jgi:hypothetical protein
MTARRAIASRARAAPAAVPADSVPAALGVNHRQFAFYVLATALVAGKRFIGFIERAQDFVFFLTIETDVFVDWHRYLPLT